MLIDRHIEILLLSNDCVIVPGLGGFVTHEVHARYDEDDCIFLPPIRTLGFNPQLQINDSLLAVSYIEAFDISYPEAIRKIEAEVEEIMQTLATKGRYEMNGIGCLHCNKEGNYTFEPCEAGVLTPDLYALSSYDFERLPIKYSEAKPETVKLTPAPVKPQKQEIEKVPTVEENVQQDEENDSEYIYINPTWGKVAIAAAAILLFAIVLFNPIESTNGYYKQMSTWSTEMIRKFIPQDTNCETIKIQPRVIKKTVVKHNAVKDTTAHIVLAANENSDTVNKENDTVKKETVKATVQESKSENVKKDFYAMVLASSITQRNAETYVSKLKEKGFKDAAVYNNGNMIRVIYGNFSSEGNAYDSLHKLRDNADFKEAWILKIKN